MPPISVHLPLPMNCTTKLLSDFSGPSYYITFVLCESVCVPGLTQQLLLALMELVTEVHSSGLCLHLKLNWCWHFWHVLQWVCRVILHVSKVVSVTCCCEGEGAEICSAPPPKLISKALGYSILSQHPIT